MSAVVVAPSLAVAAIAAVLEFLTDAGLEATADSGALAPDPIAVLVGRPSLVSRTLGGSTFTVPVTVMSGDPLSSSQALERLYAIGDAVADALAVAAYTPSSFPVGGHVDPLPSLELVRTISLSRQPEVRNAFD